MASVLAIIGPIGSGKDTASDYIAEKFGYKIFSFRDAVAEAVQKEGLELTRENMQNVSREYRDKQGENVFSRMILEKILSSGCEKALVKELRTAGDVKTIWDHFKSDMKIIKAVSTVNIRFERMKSRSRIGDPKTLEEFMHQENKEEELGYTKAFNFAEFVVYNNGDKEDLYKQIYSIMNKLNENKSLTKKRFL
jgi:dephospho-CoA kinase